MLPQLQLPEIDRDSAMGAKPSHSEDTTNNIKLKNVEKKDLRAVTARLRKGERRLAYFPMRLGRAVRSSRLFALYTLSRFPLPLLRNLLVNTLAR